MRVFWEVGVLRKKVRARERMSDVRVEGMECEVR